MSDRPLFNIDDGVRAINQVHDVLAGWYDVDKKSGAKALIQS